MENSKVCIVSVAFREPYVKHSLKQEEKWREDKFYSDYEPWRDVLPCKNGWIDGNIVEHFQKSLYGFKPHAIQDAINDGYKKVIWFDPCVYPLSSIEVLSKSLDINPLIVIIGDAPITKMANQKAKDWFGVTDEELKDIKHIGGTIYAFNFENQKVLDTFNLWKKAEEEGIFGDQDAFMAGHWADEACMSLAMYKNGMEFYTETEFKYLNQKSHPQE